MSMIQAMLQELEQEAATTRRVLERVPGDRLGWKPHEKSMSMGQLALHVAILPGAIAEMATKSSYPLPQFVQPSAQSAAELVPALERSLARAREVLGTMDDAELGRVWRLVDGERELMAVPVGPLLRSLMLNHWYHHRGQLSVYLREVGVPVPSIYGPSADESPFPMARPAAAAV
jgi:uncharacterized damage-inducible protein DinB